MFLRALLARDTSQESAYEDTLDTTLTNYVAFIGFTILVWDHIITFDDEIRYIWHGRKSALVYLFILVMTIHWEEGIVANEQSQNRYFTPLSFIGNLIAYFSDWSHKGHFVRFEGATVSLAIEITGMMMLIRIRALYADKPRIVLLVLLLLLIEIGVFTWLLTHGEAVQHGPTVHACSMIFDPSLHFFPSLSAWIPLLYDTIVIVLTVYRCIGPVKQKTASHIVRTLLKDGLLYYSVIFAVNLVLAIMIEASPPGVKNICAQLEQLLTVAMISRITLNLKREVQTDPTSEADTYLYPRTIESHLVVDYDEMPGTLRKGRSALILGQGASRASYGRRVADISFDGIGTDELELQRYRPRDLSCAAEYSIADSAEIDDPSYPPRAHAILTERDVYELRALRASAVHHV